MDISNRGVDLIIPGWYEFNSKEINDSGYY